MNKKKSITTSVVAALSSALAFLGIVSCCGFPLIAAFLALFGIGASQLNFLSQHQSLFMGIAIVSLAYGFYETYFKGKRKLSSCCDLQEPQDEDVNSCCHPKAKSNVWAKVVLWVAAAAIAFTMLNNNNTVSDNSDSNSCTATQNIKDSTAPSCCSAN